MASTIKIKNSSTAGAVPTSSDLVQGELAINVTDRRIFTENASGTVVELGTPSIDDNGNATAITIDSSENVGIGTINPLAKFNVFGANALLSNPAGTSNDSDGFETTTFAATTPYWSYLSYNASSHRWKYYNTEVMRIDSSGNLLVGTTTTNPVGTRVNGTQLGLNGFVNQRATANTRDLGISSTSGNVFNFYSDNGSAAVYAGSIAVNGNVTTYYSVSDYRLKENVEPMQGALEKVLALNPVTYTFKEGGQAAQGFIAHELQAIVPDCVVGEKDAVDENGKPVYQGIDTSFLVATLTAAIQELKSIVDTQAARITALEQA